MRNDHNDIADEYVLGLMEERQARDIEVEMERDPNLKAAIAASRERFLPLDEAAEPAVVSAGLWDRIDASLLEQVSARSPDLSQPLNDNRSHDGMGERVIGWRATALAALAATVVLAVALSFALMRTVEPLVVAVLLNEAGEIQAVVEDFGNEQATVRMLADFKVPEEKTIQVWTLPSAERGPVSLGLIDDARSAQLKGPALPVPRDSQLYELTLEQAGGSPTGKPTGLILAKGFAKVAR